jgi:hypothetical protein
MNQHVSLTSEFANLPFRQRQPSQQAGLAPEHTIAEEITATTDLPSPSPPQPQIQREALDWMHQERVLSPSASELSGGTQIAENDVFKGSRLHPQPEMHLAYGPADPSLDIAMYSSDFLASAFFDQAFELESDVGLRIAMCMDSNSGLYIC